MKARMVFRSFIIIIVVTCIIPAIVKADTKKYNKTKIYEDAKVTKTEQKKFFEEYKEHDIEEKNGILYYENKPIRCFADIYRVVKGDYSVKEDGTIIGKTKGVIVTYKGAYKYFNEKGTIDIYVERTKDTKGFGKIIKKGTSLIDFIYVMPEDIIKKVARQLEKRGEYKKLIAIACYLNSNTISNLASNMEKKGKYKELLEIACFVDRSEMDKIAIKMVEKEKYQEVFDIVWCFSQSTIDKIAKKAAKDKKYKEVSQIACFVSKNTLEEIAKKMTKEKEYEALKDIACFIA